jgi:protein tyrosine/serine phosphatase
MIILAINIDKKEDYNKENIDDVNTNITVTLPDKIYVVNTAVLEWLNGEDKAQNIYDKYRSYGRLDYTESIDFLYSINDLPVDCKVKTQQISIIDKDYSKEVFSQNVSSEKRSVNIENLRPDTVYEYHIKVEFSNGKIVEKKGEFKTEPSPCFLFVDGARNVRDIGTIKTIDGKQIKKYMVYRGSELDGAIEPKNVITEQGIDYMLNVLNIKSEMDIRTYEDNKTKDMLGETVKHPYYGLVAYDLFFREDYNEKNREFFSDLANPDIYPIYVHCSYGADRTGTAIYVLEALLGVDEETLYFDWETSLFCHGNSFYDDMEVFVSEFKSLKGDTMQEKAENYLLSIGVTKREIDSIREILLTD